MNRAERRRAKGYKPPPMCAVGEHRFAKIEGTFKGEVVASQIVCERCRLTWIQALERQPELQAQFATFMQGNRSASAPN